MKKLLTLFVAALIISCGNKKETAVVDPDSPNEVYAIDSIKFFVNEKDFAIASDKFQESHDNPKWKEDIVENPPYVLGEFGYHNIKGLFNSPDGELVGVVFHFIDPSELHMRFADNWEKLENELKAKCGAPNDIHSNLTENEVKKHGEIATSLWKNGKKTTMVTMFSEGENMGVNLYIYRNDKIQPDSTKRAIDGELEELKKLM